MKRTILLVFYIGSSIFGSGQTYHKLIRPNTYWDCSWVYTGFPAGCANTVDRIFFPGADTVLEGITYKVAYAYPMQADPPNNGNCPPYSVSNVAANYHKYIREDTVARKVFIYDPVFITQTFDQVLYDFSLQPGDSLKSYYQGDYLVTAVDSVMIATGEYRKRITLFHHPNEYSYYIEGIGGHQGLFTPIFTFEQAGTMLCVQENNVNLWGNYCNSWFVNVLEHKVQEPEIYPNPTHNQFFVSFPEWREEKLDIRFFNSLGHELRINTVNLDGKGRFSVDISDLPDGVYMIKCNFKQWNKWFKLLKK